MLYSVCIIEQKVGCIFDDCPLVHTKEGDAHEYNGGINITFVSIYGTLISPK